MHQPAPFAFRIKIDTKIIHDGRNRAVGLPLPFKAGVFLFPSPLLPEQRPHDNPHFTRHACVPSGHALNASQDRLERTMITHILHTLGKLDHGFLQLCQICAEGFCNFLWGGLVVKNAGRLALGHGALLVVILTS